jgi:hypothetical protein
MSASLFFCLLEINTIFFLMHIKHDTLLFCSFFMGVLRASTVLNFTLIFFFVNHTWQFRFSSNSYLRHMYFMVLGDDWEHEEIFTDDDEAVAIDPEEREDLAPEVPAPPEIKQVCISKQSWC